jgi:hypothetical protein
MADRRRGERDVDISLQERALPAVRRTFKYKGKPRPATNQTGSALFFGLASDQAKAIIEKSRATVEIPTLEPPSGAPASGVCPGPSRRLAASAWPETARLN